MSYCFLSPTGLSLLPPTAYAADIKLEIGQIRQMRELSLNNCRIDKRYDVVDNLGRGSYAEIFVARDTLASPQSVHSKVVIKALNVFLQDDLDADLERTLVENFQNEAIAE